MLIKLLRSLKGVFEGGFESLENKVNKSLNREKTTKSIREQSVIVIIIATILTALTLYFFFLQGLLFLFGIVLSISMFIVGIYGVIAGKMPFS